MSSSSSSTSPAPNFTRSIVELRTLLLELSERLIVFERTLSTADRYTSRRTRCLLGSPTSPAERAEHLRALSLRLVLISELLQAMDNGIPPDKGEAKLVSRLLANSIARLTSAAPAPPLEPRPPSVTA